MNKYEKFEYTLEHTEVIRPVKQKVATFGTTNIYYFLITELLDRVNRTRVREGKITVERPGIVTPYYFANSLFQGFGERGREYAEMLVQKYGQQLERQGILEYKYRNEPRAVNIISNPLEAVVEKINEKIDREGDELATIIKGMDDAWQVSLIKFIIDTTTNSLQNNITELKKRGLLNIKYEIEELFQEAKKDSTKLTQLGERLYKLGVFEEYEDRFFQLWKKRFGRKIR